MTVLVKRAKSKEALEHKRRYDTKYESSPDRVKYREELNQERRQRGIMGEGGPVVSHTSADTVTLENPHDNRARHFKERGTFKPIEKAWAFLKDMVDDVVDEDMFRVNPEPTMSFCDWCGTDQDSATMSLTSGGTICATCKAQKDEKDRAYFASRSRPSFLDWLRSRLQS